MSHYDCQEASVCMCCSNNPYHTHTDTNTGKSVCWLTVQPSALAWSIHSIASMWSIPGSSPISFTMVMPASSALIHTKLILFSSEVRTQHVYYITESLWCHKIILYVQVVNPRFNVTTEKLYCFILVVYSPALQLLHGRTQVAGCHHVYLPLDAVFGDEWVKRVRQQAEEQKEAVRSGRVAEWFIQQIEHNLITCRRVWDVHSSSIQWKWEPQRGC